MRLFHILTAVLVIAALYLLIIERERLLAFAGSETEETQSAVEESTEATDTTEQSKISVVVQRSQATDIESAVLLRGRTEAARQVQVMAETSGRVVSEPLPRGTSVSVGQTLCTLDPGTRPAALAEAQARLPEARARQAEAEARLTEAQINDRAARSLSEGGFASETRVAGSAAAVESALAAVQSARAGVQAAEAGVEAAETEIGRLDITAPFAGLLETDTAELGTLLQPGVPCAEVIQLDPIRLVGFVPETEVNRIEMGARAGARLASGRDIIGQVTFLSRSADEATRTFRVEIEVPNADLAIRDGQTVEIIVASEGEAAHLIPASALTLNDDGVLGVRIVENDVARFIAVTLLRDTVEGVWLAGLPKTADVIVIGQEYVIDGVPVDVTMKETDQ